MRNVQAAIWGAASSAVAMAFGGLLYGLLGSTPMTASDLLLPAYVALYGWFLYLVPGLAMGCAARWLVVRLGTVPGTFAAAALAVLCGVAVGYLATVNAPHVPMDRAMVSLACSWGLTALVVLALTARRIAGGSSAHPSAPGLA